MTTQIPADEVALVKESCNRFWALPIEEQTRLMNIGLDKLREVIGHVPLVMLVTRADGVSTISNLQNIPQILKILNSSAGSLIDKLEEGAQ